MIAFRGELIIKDKTFEKNWSKTLKNARNSVAGLVNSKKINPELANDTELILYEIVDPFYPIDKQLKIINDMNFNVVNSKTIDQNLTYELLSKYLKERRTKSEYLIDGIIVTSCGKYERNTERNGNSLQDLALVIVPGKTKQKPKQRREWQKSPAIIGNPQTSQSPL